MEREEKRARHAGRDADLDRERKELDRLKGELDALVERGRGPAAAAEKKPEPKKDRIEEDSAKAKAAVAPVLADSTKGGFSVRAGQFAFGDEVKTSLIMQERIAKAAEKGNVIQKKVADGMEKLLKLNPLAFL